MRGLFFGNAKRNDPIKLDDPRPLTDYGDDVQKGNAALDGFTVLSKASPAAQGSPPPVTGTAGRAYNGPDQSFEQ